MAKAPTTKATAFAAPLVYTKAEALTDTAYLIDPVETGDPAVILQQIMEHIQAAVGIRLESLHLRQRDPTTGIVSQIPNNHANWTALRNTLTGAPYSYTVTVRPAVGDIEIKWAS